MPTAYGGRPMGGGQPIVPPGFQNNSILGALKATEMIDAKAVLPLEILATILDYLPISDQMRFAQTCRRMREMVYDDTRWVVRLQSMGVWNEVEARRRFEEAIAKRRRDAAAAAAAANAAAAGGPIGGGGGVVPGGKRTASGSTMLFDASLEEERKKQLQQQQLQRQQKLQQQEREWQEQQGKLRDGFETLSIGGGGDGPQQASSSSTTAAAEAATTAPSKAPVRDTDALLNVLKNVRSIRGYARQEYAKVYGALAPFYWDLIRAKTHADPLVFKVFRDPERQAQMLANLQVFARSDWSQGWHHREEKMATMMRIFEGAVLREFEQGYEFWDIDGRMNKYAHVLDVLNGSTAGVELFIQKHPIFNDRDLSATNAMDCLRLAPASQAAEAWGSPAAAGHADEMITLEPSRKFFEDLAWKMNEQGVIIGRIFPKPAAVFWQLVDKVREDVIMEYTTPLLDETHERSLPAYLKAVAGLFEQCLQFLKELEPPKGAEVLKKEAEAAAAAEEAAKKGLPPPGVQRKGTGMSSKLAEKLGKKIPDAEKQEDEDEDDANAWTPRARLRKAKEIAYKTFEPHMDLYLQEELDFFTKHAEAEVTDWEKKLSEQDASVESFYMSSFNRQEVKKDFLSSFKKVVMMPVMLPGQLLGNPFGTSSSSASAAKTTGTVTTPTNDPSLSLPTAQLPQQSFTTSSGRATPNLPEKAPDDELAAKAALMASRLEGIKSLFSIEMALNLVHAAKASLSRAAVFVQLGGQAAGEAREQCETIFVVLLRVLGNGHLKVGFERAITHLSQYNPREVQHHRAATDANGSDGDGDDGGVAPLMTFIELVNVGDLISQMIDVFYEQQLAGPKIVDRNDFLDPAGVAKKRFEQMVDESVAAGLNKGIDVLMDEVEYICATTQKPSDYYPESADAVADSGLFFLNGSLSSVTGSGTGGASTPTSGGGGSKASLGGDGNGNGSTGSTNHNGPASSGVAFGGVEDLGPTKTAVRVVALVRGHTDMLKGSTEKTMLDVFNGEVGLRLFTAVCKHLKRQRISMAGAVHVIADMTLYFDYIRTLRNQDLLAYFRALRELSQLYLIDAKHHAKEMAVIIADADRFGGVFRAEEVYEFAERRADWYQVKRDVERAMYGLECSLM